MWNFFKKPLKQAQYARVKIVRVNGYTGSVTVRVVDLLGNQNGLIINTLFQKKLKYFAAINKADEFITDLSTWHVI